ncbi:hypothetical protein C5167_038209 [Papaver somniferum]|uniref:Uncharacterized protein n=1 Tax=Papaver somniferum TaxID=3469 RepID=A0A4Y7I8K0_PAPSO|nr:hypothetical protein C5167_038209 [Papaver somniferum]
MISICWSPRSGPHLYARYIVSHGGNWIVNLRRDQGHKCNLCQEEEEEEEEPGMRPMLEIACVKKEEILMERHYNPEMRNIEKIEYKALCTKPETTTTASGKREEITTP